MARTIPFQRSTQAAQARYNKALLLPMPHAVADELSLSYHIALEAMRTGNGYIAGAQTLTEVMLLTGFIGESGYGEIAYEALVASEQAISGAFAHGKQTGVWRLDDNGYLRFAAIVALHDRQLYSAPLAVVTAASDRLDRFKTGGPNHAAQRKRA